MGRVAKALLHNAVSIRELSIVCTDQVIKTEIKRERKRGGLRTAREKKDPKECKSEFFYDGSEKRLLHCRSIRGKKKFTAREDFSRFFLL